MRFFWQKLAVCVKTFLKESTSDLSLAAGFRGLADPPLACAHAPFFEDSEPLPFDGRLRRGSAQACTC